MHMTGQGVEIVWEKNQISVFVIFLVLVFM